ncbi:MAG: NADH-quinone oxidoreductase subunit A [Chloroflexi bacterium]|jgi:NADH-quinone oxidoreductase subunit A|nr:MAG: NADH-quinone oxidoreductase subunit A [Chloroflexota bacterium]RLT50116.1 MAG: NADH-quinone oxidoreductase subunit A [Chloroflexota bacterium]RLT54650.1 MAG: NADH-quinone oxidoreductase subunit A [Chloroflexota bacterium]
MPVQQLIQDYLPVGIYFAVSVGLAGLIAFLGHMLGPRHDTPEKLMPYESGMTPIGAAVRRVPVRYYLVAVLFILFDIEVVFFLPWAVVLRKLGMFGLLEMLVFVAILLVGYVYVWKRGALEWE